MNFFEDERKYEDGAGDTPREEIRDEFSESDIFYDGDVYGELGDSEDFAEDAFDGGEYVIEDVIEDAAENVLEDVIESVPAPAIVEYKYEEPHARGGFWKGLVAAVLVVAIGGAAVGGGIGIGIGVGQGLTGNKTAAVDSPAFTFAPTAEPTPAPAYLSEKSVGDAEKSDGAVYGILSYAEVIDAVEPSVVTIVSRSTSSSRSFFGYEYPTEGAGSGILFHEDGEKYYIVTNYHVVQNAQTVEVSIGGVGPFSAKLVGKRETSDVAVISISKSDVAKQKITVKTAAFGDSDALRVGDVVLAIGNALGEGNTATNGIISAKNKKVTIDDVVYNALQTNAAINPGNSGGALINLYGEVIGINSAKLSGTASGSSASVEGTGYAIPSNEVKSIIEELMNNTTAAVPVTPMLGIRGGTLTEALAEQLNTLTEGVYISSVTPGYPAEAAGIMASDVIVSFNGHTVAAFEDLKAAIAEIAAGDSVKVDVIRGGEYLTIAVEMFTVDGGGF